MRRSKNVLIKHIKLGDNIVFKKEGKDSFNTSRYKVGQVQEIVAIFKVATPLRPSYNGHILHTRIGIEQNYFLWEDVKKIILIKGR